MKAVIFDIDNTLIPYDKEYESSINKALDILHIKYNKELPSKIYKIIDDYEKENTMFDKDKIVNYINRKLNINLPPEFINLYIKTYGETGYIDDDQLIDTLDYLSKKYDLYVVTNWYTESQELRLKKLGMFKYFKKVYGGDINYLKPNMKTFDVILKDYLPSECVYVGDNLEKDVILPMKLGMNAIWKTDKESKDYTTIKKISDLKNIL